MKKIINATLFSSTLLAAGLFMTGCGTKAHYVDSKGPATVVSLNQLDIQDWTMASDAMVASLLESSVLERSPEKPAIMAVSRIINNTQQQVDVDLLVKKIRVALNKSGKVLTTSTIGIGDTANDPLAKELATAPATKPWFSLSGKLLEDRANVGKTKQVTYTFQLSLVEIKTGLAVWEDEKQFTKQGTKGSVGW
jgi:uncharacterized protein (TIGR02722 family)